MKSYARPFAKKSINGAINNRTESRDAILWSIGLDSSCMIKIQGSNEFVIAHFPRNQLNRPEWLRVGNAVRVTHRKGEHGYVEVVGPGRAIPSPSSGNALPAPGETADGILWGLIVSPTEPPSEGVMISDGAFRIDGTVYYYYGDLSGYMYMEDPPVVTMGILPYANMGASAFVIDEEGAEAPADGYFRYDYIVIGTDSLTHYIVGTATRGEPSEPTIPAEHILVARILRVGGDTYIPEDRIYMSWTPPKPTSAYATYPTDVYWSTQQFNITAYILDQYGHGITVTSNTEGWEVVLEKIWGTGEVYSSDSGWDEDSATKTIYGNNSSVTFSYRRTDLLAEKSPMLLIDIKAEPHLVVPIYDITLYSELGIPIPNN